MKKLSAVFAACLCAAMPLGLSACGSPAAAEVKIEVSVSDGFLVINGVKTEIRSGTDGKSAYELYIAAHPEYEGSEARWLEDIVTGKLAARQERVLVSYGRNFDGILAAGSVATAEGMLALTDAVIALSDPLVLPVGESSDWRIELDGMLMWGGAGGGQFLNSNGNLTEGRVYFGSNAGNNVVFLGVNIAGNYFNYCWDVPAAAMSARHSYAFSFSEGQFYLSLDGDEARGITSVNVSQGNATAVTDSKLASDELRSKIRAATGQDFFTLTHMGAMSHKCGMRIASLSAETSSIYDYAARASHPLADKTVFYLGSSVTRGHGGNTDGTSFAEQIANLTGNRYRKEAISGTTLAVRQGTTDSYAERLSRFPLDAEPDALVVQLSTNDFAGSVPLGTLGAGRDSDAFNKNALIGAIEYIVAKTAEESPKTKVIFYTCPLETNWAKYSEYRNFVNGGMKRIAEKWGIGVIDLFNADYVAIPARYMQSDGLHPTAEGFASLFTPAMIEFLMR